MQERLGQEDYSVLTTSSTRHGSNKIGIALPRERQLYNIIPIVTFYNIKEIP